MRTATDEMPDAGVCEVVPAWVDAPNVWSERLGSEFGEVAAAAVGLDDAALAVRLKVLDARQRELDAERSVLLAELERRKTFRRDGHASMYGLLRADVGWSNGECRDRTQLARLVEAHPPVGEALHEAWLSTANAAELARAYANPRTKDAFDTAVGSLLSSACRLEHHDYRLVIDQWLMFADVDGAHRDRAPGHERRHASLTEYDGTGTLIAHWGDLDTAVNRTVFDRFVRAEWDADWASTVEQHGDEASVTLMPRSEAQRRADALTAIFRRAGSIEPGGTAPRLVTNVHISHREWRSLLTWANLLPEQFTDPTSDIQTLVSELRCSTGDGQVIDPVGLLQASLEQYIRFIVLDDDGVPIRYGRQRRLFTGPARDAVMLLSTRCTHPGCGVPTSRCEADHLVEWSAGGSTDPANGGPRCRRHNRLRNHGYRSRRDRTGWHTHRPDGTEI